jgi:hypothetical protein
MRYLLVILFLLEGFSPISLKAQLSDLSDGRKNMFFAYWGWNREGYSDSDIRSDGQDYDFTLEKCKSKRPTDQIRFRSLFSSPKSKYSTNQLAFRIFLE